MRSPKIYVILLLTITTVGGAILAWRQYGEIVELRAQAMNRDERADLQKRVWDLEKLNRELQDQLAAHTEPTDVEGLIAAAKDGERPSRDKGGRGDRGDRGGDFRGRGGPGMQQANAVRELMNKPEVQAMLSLQQKAAIEARYSALFKNLNLPPEQVDKLKTLLAERSTTMQDVMAAAREQGISPRENPEAFRKLVSDAQNEINKGIKSVIGEQGFAQLTGFEQTMPQRNLVNELQQRLSYTSTPLTPTQAEQMVQILANNSAQRPAGNTNAGGGGGPQPGGGRGGPPGGFGGPGFGARGPDVGGLIAGAMGGGPGMGAIMGVADGPRGGGAATVTSAAVSQSQSVLAPPQVAALQQIQQQQQAQQQLRQLVNDTMTANQPNTKGGNNGKSSGGSTTPVTNNPGTGKRRGGGG